MHVANGEWRFNTITSSGSDIKTTMTATAYRYNNGTPETHTFDLTPILREQGADVARDAATMWALSNGFIKPFVAGREGQRWTVLVKDKRDGSMQPMIVGCGRGDAEYAFFGKLDQYKGKDACNVAEFYVGAEGQIEAHFLCGAAICLYVAI